MYKFKLIKKINPQDKSAPKKWYAVPISESPQSFRETARRATQNTTISAMELETAIDLLGSYAIEQLLAGHTIRIGNLGTAYDPDRQSGHITYHLQERGRREHRRLQYLVYD